MTHDAPAMIEYDSSPIVLVLADSADALARASGSAVRAGCRVSGALGLDDAAERLDLQAAFDAVMLEVDGDHGDALDRLLDRLESAASAGRHRSIVAAPPALIDVVAARAGHIGIQHLCNAREAERTAAIEAACARGPARLHDVGKGQGAASLQQLSEEVGRIANILANLSDEALAEAPPPGEGEAEVSAAMVRAVIRARRLREQYFQSALFSDPAWDMLLDLMAARLDRQRVAVSSLCIAAAVPATTALRWIKTLTDNGLFVRIADPQDGRRVFIELSDKAAAQLSAYMRALQRIAPLVV